MSDTIEYATQSATISQASPSVPDAGSQFLEVSGTAAANLRAFLDVEHGVPIGEEAEVVAATLYLTRAVTSGSDVDLDLYRADDSWDAASATWSEQPGTTGSVVSVTIPAGAAGEEVAITLTSLISAAFIAEDAGTTSYYGLRLSTPDTGVWSFYGAEVSDRTYHPRLEVTYSVQPDEVTDLIPDDGLAVSSDSPTLYGSYANEDAEASVNGIAVRIADNDLMATPFYESGEVGHDEPTFDTSDPPSGSAAFTPLGAGPHYWQMKVRSGTRWSEWSDVASFTVEAKGTFLITSPALIDSPVPVLVSEMTVDTQQEVEVYALRMEDGFWQEHYLLPRHLSSEDSHAIPDEYRLVEGYLWRLGKRAWPTVAREDSPGDREFYEDWIEGWF